MSNAFLKLSTEEKTKNLELAKAVLQAETNKQLKDYRIDKLPGYLCKEKFYMSQQKGGAGYMNLLFSDISHC